MLKFTGIIESTVLIGLIILFSIIVLTADIIYGEQIIKWPDTPSGIDYTYKAKITKIVDGDTIYMDVDLGFGVYYDAKVRLLQIDAWEIRGEEKERGIKAKEFVEKNYPVGSEVLLQSSKQGKYGRWLGTVWNIGDTKSLNQLLVENEHAEIYQEE